MRSDTHHHTTVRVPPSDPLLYHTQSVTNKHFIWQLEWCMKNNTACPPLFNSQQTSRDYPLAILTMKLRVYYKGQWREERQHSLLKSAHKKYYILHCDGIYDHNSCTQWSTISCLFNQMAINHNLHWSNFLISPLTLNYNTLSFAVPGRMDSLWMYFVHVPPWNREILTLIY